MKSRPFWIFCVGPASAAAAIANTPCYCHGPRPGASLWWCQRACHIPRSKTKENPVEIKTRRPLGTAFASNLPVALLLALVPPAILLMESPFSRATDISGCS